MADLSVNGVISKIKLLMGDDGLVFKCFSPREAVRRNFMLLKGVVKKL